MIVIPHSKPSELDSADYLNYAIRSIGIGYICAIATFIVPFWIVILLAPKRNQKLLGEMVSSSAFQNSLEFIGNYFWTIFFISGLFFSMRYLYLNLTKNRIQKITLNSSTLDFTVQKAFKEKEIKQLPIDSLKITTFNHNKEGILGNRLKMIIVHDQLKFKINTNKDPWNYRDIGKLIRLKKKIVEINPEVIPAYHKF